MRFYEGALNAKLDVLVKSGDVPNARPPGSADMLMHTQLSFNDGAAY